MAQTDQTGGCNVHATVHNPHCAEGSQTNPPPPDGDDDDDDGDTGPGVVDDPGDNGGDNAVDAGRGPMQQGQPATSEVGGARAGPRVDSGNSGVLPADTVTGAGVGLLAALVAMTVAGGVMAYRRVQ